MDRARDFHYVKQLPRSTVPEVEYSDDVYDRQVLLNETWEHYAARAGYPVGEEHVKWVTETWEEYWERCPKRAAALEAYFANVKNESIAAAERAAQREAHSTAQVERLMKEERAFQASKLPVLHTLFVDFEEEVRLKHIRQRADAEAAEQRRRAMEAAEEAAARKKLMKEAEESFLRAKAILDERNRALEEEEAKRREEQHRKAEALRQIEEDKKRAAEEAERRRREEEEEARRAERRRKDEERRAKAKAEREARAGGARKGPTKDEQRATSRQARWARMATEMSDYLQRLPVRCDAVLTHDQLAQLESAVANELGGALLFHSAVYFAQHDSSGCLKYPIASSNCSNKLKSGLAVLSRQDGGEAVPITFASCVEKGAPTGIVRNAQKQVVNIGDWPAMGSGDYFACPILNANERNRTVGVLCCDTMSANTPDAVLAGGASEEHCYASSEGAAGPEVVYVPMPEAQAAFLERVAALLSQVVSRLTEAPKPPPSRPPALAVPPLPLPATLTTLPDFFNLITGHIQAKLRVPNYDGPVRCYVSRRPKPDGNQCTVVSQNGVGIHDPARHSSSVECHLLGCALEDPSALTFAAFPPGAGVTHFYAPDVRAEPRAQPFVKGNAKSAECLLLIPFRDTRGRILAQAGISVDAPPGLDAATIEQLLAFFDSLSGTFCELVKHQQAAAICSQAAEWLSLVTGTGNVYVGIRSRHLRSGAADGLEYVAASDDQKWLVGKQLPPGTGVVQPLLDAPKASDMVPTHIRKVAQYVHPETGRKVHLLDPAKSAGGADGAFLLCPVAQGSEVLGVLCADTVGTHDAAGRKPKTEFTRSDEQLIQTTAQLLGGLLGRILRGTQATVKPASDLSARVLAIEERVGAEKIEFLKEVWSKVTNDIRNITKDQLLEMARYNSPPPVIPVVVAATLIVLGTKPKAVEKWEDTRPRIKPPLIDKIVAFDATSTKVKKSFFIRARRMTKDYTADDVYTKGSYPASCFFTWTWVTILLRRSADAIRKQLLAGDVDAGTVAESETTGGDLSEAPDDVDVAADAAEEEDAPADGNDDS